MKGHYLYVKMDSIKENHHIMVANSINNDLDMFCGILYMADVSSRNLSWFKTNVVFLIYFIPNRKFIS
jgi:hypothetical protein